MRPENVQFESATVSSRQPSSHSGSRSVNGSTIASVPTVVPAAPKASEPNVNDCTLRKEPTDTRTAKQKKAEIIQLMALNWFVFLIGWNDGANGPLLPRIQEHYHVGYTVVSMIFVCSCGGFISGALINFVLTDRLGLGKVRRSMLQTLTFIILATTPPFPVFVIVYIMNGIGIALQYSQGLGLIASIKRNGDTKMGVFHAFYGLGALSSPFVATQFSQMPRHWAFYYLTTLGVAVSNTVVLTVVFGSKGLDECLRLIGEDTEANEKDTRERSSFNQVFRIKAVHFLAFFVLFYVGIEVSVGGWIVTFMLNVRGGGPNTGYISSGFFAGLMFGRVGFIWLNRRLGPRLALFLYGFLVIGLELIIWFVPSLIGGAVAVSFIGFLLGPMYPMAMVHAGAILPAQLLTSSVGWIAGFGQAGSAVLPFLTGAVASKYGIRSLQPLTITLIGCMLCLWYLVPGKRRD
ncbi:MFS general substrate transporter [Macrolepiota fuliginosa MF-IS2]|uniref:MFS general substrate transporter n=1 Tax=Macrolepiota fuliginosa MF-IS2 TaxID=1400762 RepID=A0A9P5XB60_9AGAR|nr:MFS general substrate transporter [Macrolepiota fuliginosa MF-IS2]